MLFQKFMEELNGYRATTKNFEAKHNEICAEVLKLNARKTEALISGNLEVAGKLDDKIYQLEKQKGLIHQQILLSPSHAVAQFQEKAKDLEKQLSKEFAKVQEEYSDLEDEVKKAKEEYITSLMKLGKKRGEANKINAQFREALNAIETLKPEGTPRQDHVYKRVGKLVTLPLFPNQYINGASLDTESNVGISERYQEAILPTEI